MSYILDALRKSQAERDAGTLPSLLSGAGYGVDTRRPRAGLAAAAALLLLVLGVGIGLWQPWRRAEPPAAPRQAATPPPPTVAGAVPQTETRAPEPAESVPVLSAASPPPAAPIGRREIEPVRPREPEREANPPRGTVRPAAEAPAAPVRQAAGIAAVPRREVAAPTPTARQAASAAAAEVPPAGIVSYQELPPSIREVLPKLSLTGFAAVDETSARLAFVNDRVVKEGDEVSPGVRLERVDADGMVLNYRGYRFRAEGR